MERRYVGQAIIDHCGFIDIGWAQVCQYQHSSDPGMPPAPTVIPTGPPSVMIRVYQA